MFQESFGMFQVHDNNQPVFPFPPIQNTVAVANYDEEQLKRVLLEAEYGTAKPNVFQILQKIRDLLSLLDGDERQEVIRELSQERCWVTGNPLGTDTWSGDGCKCEACEKLKGESQ